MSSRAIDIWVLRFYNESVEGSHTMVSDTGLRIHDVKRFVIKRAKESQS